MNRAVFLDRDGVINRAVARDGRPFPPASLEKFEFLPGVVEAVAMLRRAGFRIIVATNQPDVGKGAQRREVVEAIHVHMQSVLPIDAVKVCYHTDENECACRKPKPGMLLEAAAEWSLDLSRSFMVGDRWRCISPFWYTRMSSLDDVRLYARLLAGFWRNGEAMFPRMVTVE